MALTIPCSLHLTNKASNMAMSVPLFINVYIPRCPVIHNHRNYTISVLVYRKGVKSFGKQLEKLRYVFQNCGKSESCR